MISVLIPAYNPDEKLITLVEELQGQGFSCVVVNDGSDPSCGEIFRQLSGAAVIGYGENRGKGAALRFGMEYIRDNLEGVTAFITADADGQHRVSDICKVRDELAKGKDFVISVRNLRRNIPILSKIGNDLSRFMFTIANEHYLPDNQSGLRGFSVRHIPWMLKVSGDKYDYELNVILIAEKQGIRAAKVPIETIYFDNNSGSHFKPVLDTVRIYIRYFETNIAALIAAVINLALAALATAFFGSLPWPGFMTAGALPVICWGIHSFFTLVIERYVFFRWIRYTPGSRRLVISIFKYFICSLVCTGAFFFRVPLILGYIAGMVGVSIGEYYVLKLAND